MSMDPDLPAPDLSAVDGADGANEVAEVGNVEEPAAVRRVRAAQQQLGQVEGQPLVTQIETYDGVHGALQDALAELDGA